MPSVSRLVEQSRRLSVGYAFDADVFMGPLISESPGLGTSATHAAGGDTRPCWTRRSGPPGGGSIASAVFAVDWDAGQPFLGDEPGPMLRCKVSNWRRRPPCTAKRSTDSPPASSPSRTTPAFPSFGPGFGRAPST